ncbi:hypothetical protein ACSBR2_030490 [Camellia fascicularis]
MGFPCICLFHMLSTLFMAPPIPDAVSVMYISPKRMDAVVMLLCSFRSTNVAYNLKPPYASVELVNFVCDKFVGLTPGNIFLLFKMPGYNNFSLQNDVDMENMVLLAHSFRFHLIDVMVQLRGCVSVTSNDDFVDDNPISPMGGVKRSVRMVDVDYDADLLPTYCPHDENTFLLAT